MIGSRRPAPYGRKRNSGQAALATLGDGWREIKPPPSTTGPFGSAPDEVDLRLSAPVFRERLAKHSVELVLRGTARARRTSL